MVGSKRDESNSKNKKSTNHPYAYDSLTGLLFDDI